MSGVEFGCQWKSTIPNSSFFMRRKMYPVVWTFHGLPAIPESTMEYSIVQPRRNRGHVSDRILATVGCRRVQR
jgi:hypothetical protein